MKKAERFISLIIAFSLIVSAAVLTVSAELDENLVSGNTVVYAGSTLTATDGVYEASVNKNNTLQVTAVNVEAGKTYLASFKYKCENTIGVQMRVSVSGSKTVAVEYDTTTQTSNKNRTGEWIAVSRVVIVSPNTANGGVDGSVCPIHFGARVVVDEGSEKTVQVKDFGLYEQQALSVTAIPNDGSENVPLNTSVTYTFSNPLSAPLSTTHISGATATGVEDLGNNSYRASFSGLAKNTTYTITLENVTDVFGQSAESSVSFTTTAVATDEADPDNGAQGDDNTNADTQNLANGKTVSYGSTVITPDSEGVYTASDVGSGGVVQAEYIPVAAGKTYNVSYDIKITSHSTGGAQPRVSVSGGAAALITVGDYARDVITSINSSTWTTVTRIIAVYPNTGAGGVDGSEGEIHFGARVLGSGKTVEIRNISVTEAQAPEGVFAVTASPASGAENISVTSKTFKFNFTYPASTVPAAANVSLGGGNGTVAVPTVTGVNEWSVTVSELEYNTNYTLTLTGVKDCYRRDLEDFPVSFVTEDAPGPIGENIFIEKGFDYSMEGTGGRGAQAEGIDFGYNSSHATVEEKTGWAADGVKYAEVTNRTVDYNNNFYRVVNVPITESGTYLVSLYLKMLDATDTDSARIVVEYGGGSANVNKWAVSYDTETKTDIAGTAWTKVETEVVITETNNGTNNKLHLQFRTDSAKDICVDNFELRKLNTYLLGLTDVSPENGETDVELSRDMTLTFTSKVPGFTTENISIDNGAQIGTISTDDEKTYNVELINLRNGVEYTVTLTDVHNEYTGVIDGMEIKFTTVPREPAVNLITENAGFEDGAANTRWKFAGGHLSPYDGPVSPAGDWVITDAESNSGTYSLFNAGCDGTCQAYYNQVTLLPNTEYVLVYYAKLSSGVTVKVRNEKISGSPVYEGAQIKHSGDDLNNEWQRHQIVFNTGDVEKAGMRLFIGEGPGKNYFDDFSIYKYAGPMNYVYATVDDGAECVPVDVETISLAFTNAFRDGIDLSEYISITGGAIITGITEGADCATVNVALATLNNSTEYTISVNDIPDEIGQTASASITFTTTPSVTVKTSPVFSGGVATAVIENSSSSEMTRPPVLLYAVYNADGTLFSAGISDSDTPLAAYTERTLTAAVGELTAGQTVEMYILNSLNDLTSATSANISSALPTNVSYDINTDMGVITVTGKAPAGAQVPVILLKPAVDGVTDTTSEKFYSAIEEAVSPDNITDANFSDCIAAFAMVTADDNGEFTAELKKTAPASDSDYILLLKGGSMASGAKGYTVYYPSAATVNAAKIAINSAAASEDVKSAIEANDYVFGLNTNNSVYSAVSDKIATAVLVSRPGGGYTVSGLKTAYEQVMIYYTRQLEALSAINSADAESLKTILETYSDVLGDFGATPLNYTDKYNKYGYLQVNRLLVGVVYNSMNDFVNAFTAALPTTFTPSTLPQTSVQGGNSSNAGAVYVPTTVLTGAEEPMEIFTDIEIDWAKESILNLANRGVVDGVGDRKFNPYGNVTREQFVKMLILSCEISITSHSTHFADADNSQWYAPYVATAYELGIVNGISSAEFGIGQPITRQEIAAMIYRTCEISGVMPEQIRVIHFSDSNLIASYAADAVMVLSQSGIINGMSDSMFAPLDYATRAQTAVMLDRLYNI